MSVYNPLPTPVPLKLGGTGADLSTTGGASFVVRQSSTGAIFTVSQLAASDLSNGVTGSGAVVLATSPIFLTSLTAPSSTTLAELAVIQFEDGNWGFDRTKAAGAGSNEYHLRAHISSGNAGVLRQFQVVDSGNANQATFAVDADTGNVKSLGFIDATNGFKNSGAAGASAGPFSVITSIQSSGGIVITLTGTSDERLKTDIKPFERGLDAIVAIEPKLYKWNEEGQKKTGFKPEQEFAGFIAQDVQKAIPEAVGVEGDYLSLDTRPIIAALVNAVKELSARVEELEALLKLRE